MAIAYVTTLRTTRMTDIVTAIGTSGKLRIYSRYPPGDGRHRDHRARRAAVVGDGRHRHVRMC